MMKTTKTPGINSKDVLMLNSIYPIQAVSSYEPPKESVYLTGDDASNMSNNNKTCKVTLSSKKDGTNSKSKDDTIVIAGSIVVTLTKNTVQLWRVLMTMKL